MRRGCVRAPQTRAHEARAPQDLKNRDALETLLQVQTTVGGGNLSGGLAQSVALARIFLRTSSQLVILDEATGQMDAIKLREFVIPNVFNFVKKHNMTLIVISHDLPSVSPLVDCVYVLEGGKIVQQGPHERLISQKSDVYARLYGV